MHCRRIKHRLRRKPAYKVSAIHAVAYANGEPVWVLPQWDYVKPKNWLNLHWYTPGEYDLSHFEMFVKRLRVPELTNAPYKKIFHSGVAIVIAIASDATWTGYTQFARIDLKRPDVPIRVDASEVIATAKSVIELDEKLLQLVKMHGGESEDFMLDEIQAKSPVQPVPAESGQPKRSAWEDNQGDQHEVPISSSLLSQASIGSSFNGALSMEDSVFIPPRASTPLSEPDSTTNQHNAPPFEISNGDISSIGEASNTADESSIAELSTNSGDQNGVPPKKRRHYFLSSSLEAIRKIVDSTCNIF